MSHSYSRTRFRPTLSYFSMIIAGPKQGPIIDLVKTPGRKKEHSSQNQSGYYGGTKSRKYYIIIARLRHIYERHSASNRSAHRKRGRPKSVQVADIPQVTASIEPELQAAIPLQHYSENPTSDSSTPFPTSERGTELSVIAEGDESPERTHAVTLPSFSAFTFSQEELRDTVPRSCQETQDHMPPGWALELPATTLRGILHQTSHIQSPRLLTPMTQSRSIFLVQRNPQRPTITQSRCPLGPRSTLQRIARGTRSRPLCQLFL
ncbi:hypothetical protein EV363DRAFT_1161224 [Boletus edulis]|nr:hypothetical protein EV363DRAFT_1161224 [Boletus edulis]